MMSNSRSKAVYLVVLGIATLCGLPSRSKVWAGPARYDPETRSIRFTYTYAALADGLAGEAAIGAPQKPSSEQDAQVRTVVLKVSDALSKATGGRLKILSLDLVPDVKRADVVISLTGKPRSAGWAMAGAIEGRPGQIGLYYQALAEQLQQDHVLTAAHEVCHYVFGVVDEYNFPSGCPSSNLGGPGCLMDNYLSQGTRHGWYGRFCATDHVANPAQRSSCQEIVDRFFRERGVTTLGPASESASEEAQEKTVATTSVDNRKSKIDNITRAAIGLVHEQFQAKLKDGKTSAALTSITALRPLAKSFLKSQLELNQVGLSEEEQKNLIEGVLKQSASLVKVAIPSRFVLIAEVIGNLAKERAKELKKQSPKDNENSRKRKIEQGLVAFLSGLSGAANAPTIVGKLTSEEKKYLEHVAMQAATISEEQELNEVLIEAARNHIKLDRETANNVLDIAGELGVVGIESRLAAIGEVDADLRLYMPGRTASSGFGRRRTIIIDPDPLDPRLDYVPTQSGIHRYADLRDQYVDLFSKLVDRARIELLTTEAQRIRQDERRKQLAKRPEERFYQDQVQRLAALADINKVRAQREAELRAVIGELGQQIRRNRLENIVFLIPPGGLPRDISALFEGLRRQLIVHGDVRLDLVVVGASDVPFELRDVAISSGGSISTIADVDEVGAVAQRLKNDQSSGCWVVMPHQDQIQGPQAVLESSKKRAEEQWILHDTKGGRLKGVPIEYPYLDVRSRLAYIYEFFGVSRATDPRQGRFAETTWCNHILGQAAVMPPVAIEALGRSVVQVLIGGRKEAGADRKALDDGVLGKEGLVDHLEALNTAIRHYNDRNPGIGSGAEMRSAIIDRVIQAKIWTHELRSLLEIAVASHRPYLAPDYKEEAVFDRAYEVYREVYKNKYEDGDLWSLVRRVDSKGKEGSSVEDQNAGKDKLATEEQKYKEETDKLRGLGDFRLLSQTWGKDNGGKGGEPQEGAETPPGTSNFLAVNLAKYSKKVEATRSREEGRPVNLEAKFWVEYPNGAKIDLILFELERAFQQWYDVTPPKDLVKLANDSVSEAQRAGAERPTDAERDLADYMNNARRQAAPTIAYIALKKQLVRLQAVEEFLNHIERELAQTSEKSLSGRIDRRALVLAIERLQDASPGVLDGATGRLKHRPLAPVDTYVIENGEEKRRDGAYRLPRFYAENILFDPKRQTQAEFELIVGFSKPLPGVDLSALRENRTELLPDLRLYNDNGQLVTTPTLRLDRDLSTPTCLVYHFAPEFKEEGWYTGALLLKPEMFRAISEDVINFTFSVASTRPNFRLNSAQVQLPNDPELIPPPPNKGLARVMDRRVKVEVQVYGGTSILGASIRGVLYKIGEGTEMIHPIGQSFYDDGETSGDRTKGDGVYTTIVPLDQIEKGMEYRLLIQAESTENSRNIAPENPNVNDEKRRQEAIAQGVKTVLPLAKKDDPEKEDPAVIFQRASSLQIRVER